GETSGMQREADWAKGKTNEFEMLEAVAEAAAFSGKLQKAREIYAQAIESARRGKFEESAAGITARQAATEGLVGNETQARATAQEALAMDRSRATAFFAGLALAMADDTRQAAAVVDELSKRFPGDTVVNNSWGPTIRSEIEVNRGNASKAIELLQLASPYETGLVVRLVPNYARGQAYLKARQAKEAAAEFQKSWIIAGYARPHRPAPCPISNWGERAFCPATRLRPA